MSQYFAEMLSELSNQGVSFMIVGAHAMAVHGVPRATGDIDIWVAPTYENAKRLLVALRNFRAPTYGLTADEFATTEVVLQIGLPPNRIDILSRVTGLDFQTAMSRCVASQFEGAEVNFLSLADLVRNKLATKRTKDALDVELLCEALGEHVRGLVDDVE